MEASMLDMLIRIITLDGITPSGLLIGFAIYQEVKHQRYSKKIDEAIRGSLERNAKALEEVAQGVKTNADTFKVLTEWNKETCDEAKKEMKEISKITQTILHKVSA